MDPVALFRKYWMSGRGSLTIFSSGTKGVPTLTTMQDLSKELGTEVVHAGMGVFLAKRGGKTIFSFLAGGAMERGDGYSYSQMDISEGNRSKVLSWLRRKYPGLMITMSGEMSKYWKNPSNDELNAEHRRLRTMLTRAVNSKDPRKVVAACRAALKVWATWRAWPDQWSNWERALGDALPWGSQISLEDLERGVEPRYENRSNPKLGSDWNWGRGSMSNLAIRSWPEHKAFGSIQPSPMAGLWNWEVVHNGKVIANGNAKSSNHAKKWVTDTIGRTFSRSNPPIGQVRCITCGALKPSASSPCPVRASIGAKAHAAAHPSGGRKNPTNEDKKCGDCGRAVYYGKDDRYHHLTSPEKGCFLIRAEDRSGSPIKSRTSGGILFPRSWLTASGAEVNGGDLVEFVTLEGPRGSHGKVVRATVNKLLIFEDHVQVNRGTMGTRVDDENFIRVVRRARKA